MHKEVKALVGELEAQGWRLERRKSKTVAFSPDGVTVVPIHHTPSDGKSLKNTVSQLKRGGYRPRNCGAERGG